MKELPNDKRIAFVVWETTRLPKDEYRALEKVNHIWVPSQWGKSILVQNGFAENSIHVIPEGVDTNLFSPTRQFNNKSGRFRFLCVAKWEERKGVKDLINAFCEEFKPSEKVELVLHSHKTSVSQFDLMKNVRSLNLPTSPLISVSPPLPAEDLPSLYNSCDAFVLATKGEGWGLPIVEAMSCELPVIVTNYSAPSEFVNSANGYLIRVAYMSKARDEFAFSCPETDYGYWAQPDLDHLKCLMRRVFEYQAESQLKGVHGRKDVLKKWTWNHAAQKAAFSLRSLQSK